MANQIQIKRSLNTAIPTSLANGELAYTANGDVFYIGSNGAVVAIAGKRVPGTLTANQAIVANASSWVDATQTSKLILGPTTETINVTTVNTTANSTVLGGASNGELTTTWAIKTYVDNVSGAQTLDGLSDVDTTDVANGDVIAYSNGTGWVDRSIANGLSFSTTSIDVAAGNSQVISNTSGVFIDQSQIDHDSLSNFVTNEHIDHSTVSILSGNGLDASANGDLTASRTLSVVGGTGVTSNATGVHIGQAVGTADAVTFEDLTVNGNTILGDAATDTVTITADVASSITPSANVTYSLGSSTDQWANIYVRDVHSTNATFGGDVSISGNLNVTGTTVTINAATLTVEDPLIRLADQNAADTVDIGFWGLYNDGAARYAGLFRDASDSGKFKLFENFTETDATVTTIDTSNLSFTTATLVSYLESGALVSNSSVLNITATGSISSAIQANTLTLTTALAGTSGGTGLASYTAEDILVANSTNGFTALGKGSDGEVLQVVSGSVAYGTLDGGTF